MKNKLDHLSFPPSERKGDRTRLKIIEAAMSCIVRQGGTRLTFETVGKAVGMNRAQIRYHFPELSTLVFEASKMAAHRSQTFAVGHLASAKTAREKVERYIEAAFHSSCEVSAQIPVLVHSYERGLHQKEFRKLYEIIANAGNERLAALLGDLLQAADPSVEDLATLADSIRALLTGMVLDMHLRKRTEKVERHISAAKASVFVLVAGLVARS